MPGFFRSDSRGLSIFNEGFRASKEYTPQWWHNALKRDPQTVAETYYPTDVNSEYAVCISTCLEVVPIFPFKKVKDLYIYVMFLPEPTSLLEASGEYQLAERKLNNDPKNRNLIIDLHNLQVEQTASIVEREVKTNPFYDDFLGLYSGFPLYAYENYAYEISKENIYCALKIKRRALRCASIKVDGLDDIPVSRYKFKITQVIYNSNFLYQMKHEELRNGKWSSSTYDFSAEVKEMNAKIATLMALSSIRTPKPWYGLGGKVLPMPRKHSREKLEAEEDAVIDLFLMKCLRSNSIFAKYYRKKRAELAGQPKSAKVGLTKSS